MPIAPTPCRHAASRNRSRRHRRRAAALDTSRRRRLGRGRRIRGRVRPDATGGTGSRTSVPSPRDGFRLNAITAHETVTPADRGDASADPPPDRVPASGWRSAAVAFAAACSVAGLGLGAGGYFPSAWGWGALWFGWLAVMSLVLRGEI